uniref:Protein kinase domain-containing protein n=1 Tax=Aegilops tauschii subsp. strangulata TaxID=200361 RepID=A0A452ZG55_AEGTS
MGTEISVEGDVYSYGVLLLEMLTGRRPTDPFFNESTNLPNYIEMACPGNLLETMDVNIRCNQEPKATLELFAAPVSKLGLACCRGPDLCARRRRRLPGRDETSPGAMNSLWPLSGVTLLPAARHPIRRQAPVTSS